MPRDLPSIPLTAAPSYMSNNLCSSSSDVLGFARLHEAYVKYSSSDTLKKVTVGSGGSSSSGQCRVYQVAFVTVEGMTFYAVASDLGLQLWSEDGVSLHFFFSLEGLEARGGKGEEEADLEHRFMRGLASLGTFVAVGTSGGRIVLLSQAGSSGSDFTLAFNLESSAAPITALSSSSSLLVAANDEGGIYGYDAYEAFSQAFHFQGGGSGYPCTAICQIDNILVAGFSTGHLRIYRTDIQELAVEVTGHTRAITGLAYNPASHEVATCGADQYVHVWAVPDFRSAHTSVAENTRQILLEDKILTGLCFDSSGCLVVAAYDEDQLTVITPT